MTPTSIPYGSKGYQLFKHYVRFLHSQVFYKNVYYIGTEHIPAQGVPTVFASNHQNCACDPLLLLLGLENESHPYVVARGDVFGKNKFADRFFNWLGLVPAFRLNFDGAEALKKNDQMLAVTEQKLLEGNRLIIFPEGGHQDKRYLGDFSFGYTRLAFQAAEKSHFEQDIVIVPCCNHYSDYLDPKAEAMYQFGEPVHLQPYYELYKTKPRTAQRQVNQIVRERIQAMMLDIRDLEHYDEIDFLRIRASKPQPLPKQLADDRAFVATLSQEQNADPALYAHRCQQAKKDMTYCQEHGLDPRFLQPVSIATKLWHTLLSILILPIWLVSLWPNILLYNIPRFFLRKDIMFTNTWRLILSIVFALPLLQIATLLIAGCCFGWWWQALAWILCYPLTVSIAWYGWAFMRRTIQEWKL